MIWLTLIAGISALLFFSIMRKSNAEVKTLVVEIEKINDGEQLISEKEIKQILQLAAGKTITKANIKSLNLSLRLIFQIEIEIEIILSTVLCILQYQLSLLDLNRVRLYQKVFEVLPK